MKWASTPLTAGSFKESGAGNTAIKAGPSEKPNEAKKSLERLLTLLTFGAEYKLRSTSCNAKERKLSSHVQVAQTHFL